MVKGAVLNFGKTFFVGLKNNLQKTVFKTSYKTTLEEHMKYSLGMLKKAEAKMKARNSRSINLSKAQKLPEDRRGQTNISNDSF